MSGEDQRAVELGRLLEGQRQMERRVDQLEERFSGDLRAIEERQNRQLQDFKTDTLTTLETLTKAVTRVTKTADKTTWLVSLIVSIGTFLILTVGPHLLGALIKGIERVAEGQ